MALVDVSNVTFALFKFSLRDLFEAVEDFEHAHGVYRRDRCKNCRPVLSVSIRSSR